MTAQMLVGLLEEMVDLKIRQHTETAAKLPADLKRLLQEQRETDRRRLEAVRSQLVEILEGSPG